MASGHITKRGSSFRVVVEGPRDLITGKRRQISRTVRGSKREAERVRAQLLVEVAEGREDGADTTMATLLDRWHEAGEVDWSPRTAMEHRRIVDRMLKPRLGEVPVRRLGPRHLDELYSRLLTSGGARGGPLAPATVRRVHVVLRSALETAVRWEWIPANPAARAKPPKVPRSTIEPPRPDQVTRLVAWAQDHDPAFHLYVRLSALTGARRGEVCAITWGDLDEGCTTVEIRRSVVLASGRLAVKETKTGATRRISLDQGTASELEALRRERLGVLEDLGAAAPQAQLEEAFVFTTDPEGRAPWRPDSVSRRFRTLCEKAGVEGVRLHDLRHYVATRLIAAGVDIRTVAGRLGHASPTTTLNVYSHFVRQRDQEAADLLAAELD